jgi:Ca2+-binding EF-hand superfamily protein
LFIIPSGTIDAWELKETLKAMGQNPTDEEVFQMLSQVDDDGSGSIEFPEFLKVIEAQKEASAAQNDESDLIDAFVAMGGLTDKSGHVEAEKLRRTIKAFELTVDIDRLIEETDTDGSGEIDYDEFKGEDCPLCPVSPCGTPPLFGEASPPSCSQWPAASLAPPSFLCLS